jgi:predicted sulfurtransferase
MEHPHRNRQLGGRIRIAAEGLNATLSAVDGPAGSAAAVLRHFCYDLHRFDPIFRQTDFKFHDELAADRHFKDFKLLPVRELVYYSMTEEQAPLAKTGTHLEARDFHAALQEKDAVVIDVRNHYEAALGRFDGQQDAVSGGGAAYMDPKMRKSTDFTGWLAQPETQERLRNKKVLMYCTGGVRCERASAHVNLQLGSEVKGVYQLQGGIERYLKAFPDGGFWRGKNFVFDKREAVSAGDRHGDGGVLEHHAKKKKRSKNSADDDIIAEGKETCNRCAACATPWDRYVGKKKCATCGVPVLMCDQCMSAKVEDRMLVRCPLCVEDNVRVRADEVEWTNNGLGIDKNTSSDERKAAPSVLKWGGGHAATKKLRRRFQQRPCRFGADCVRKDCFFSHPPKKP